MARKRKFLDRMRKKKFLDRILLCILFMSFLTVFNEKLFMSFDLGVDYILIATEPASKIITQKVADQPPVYFLILKGWMLVFGKSLISLRVFLYINLVGLILTTYHLSMKLFKSRYTALLSSLLISQNPTVIWFTFDPKYWMVLTFLSALSLYLFILYVEKPTFKRQVLWGLSAGILPATCLVGFGIVAAFVLYLAYSALSKKIRLSKMMIPISIILLLSASVVYRFEQAKSYLTTTQASKEDAKNKEPQEFFKDSLKGLFLFFIGELSLWHKIFLYFILATAVLGLLAAAWHKNRFSLLLALWLAIILVGGYYSSKQTILRDRYFLPILPVVFILSANFLSRIPYKRILVFLTIFVVASSSVFFYAFFVDFHFPDWKKAGEIAMSLKKPGDTVIIVKDLFKRAVQEVYGVSGVQGYDDIDGVKLPTKGDAILAYEGDLTNKLDGLRTEFNFNNSFALDGVGIHKLSRKETLDSLLSKELSNAKISLIKDGEKVDCMLPESKDVCFGEDWQEVRVVNLMIDEFKRECIFAHPRGGQTLELYFPKTVLEESLVVYAGMEDDFLAERDQLSQVYIDVYFGNEKLDTLVVPSKKGYFHYVLDTSKYAGKKGVKFRFYTDYDVKRHLCFNAATSSDKAGTLNDFFYRNINKARVYVTDGNDREQCGIWREDSTYPHHEQEPPFKEGKLFLRWDCEENLLEKGKLWATFAQGFDSSAGVYRKALWAHPHEGKTLKIEYEDVPLNGSLSGFYSINDLAFSNMPDNRINFTIKVDDKVVYFKSFGKRMNWVDFSVTDGIPTGKSKVSFEVQAETNKWAHFYFNAFI
jgi:hypothetical protein